MMPPWKNFNQWREEADPDQKLTTSLAVDVYENWKSAWAWKVAEKEIQRQQRSGEQPRAIVKEAIPDMLDEWQDYLPAGVEGLGELLAAAADEIRQLRGRARDE